MDELNAKDFHSWPDEKILQLQKLLQALIDCREYEKVPDMPDLLPEELEDAKISCSFAAQTYRERVTCSVSLSLKVVRYYSMREAFDRDYKHTKMICGF